MDFVRGMVGNLFDLFCCDYTEGSDKCDKLGKFWYFQILGKYD